MGCQQKKKQQQKKNIKNKLQWKFRTSKNDRTLVVAEI